MLKREYSVRENIRGLQ